MSPRIRPQPTKRSASGQSQLEQFDDGAAPLGPTLAPPTPLPRPAALPGTWQVVEGWIAHPLLASSELRALPFQLDMARIGLTEDLLVVLPTGLGKTVIAALVAAEVLRRGDGRMLMLAPTRPLVQQHANSFQRWMPGQPIARFTGTVRRPEREGRWDSARLIFATPEMVANDLAAERYDLRSVDLLVVDEAHHAVGKYAYVPIAARFQVERGRDARLLGLTASPGGQEERIEEVVGALGVRRIEARSREDPGVKEFVQPVDVEYRWVTLPDEAKRIQEALTGAVRATGHKLQKMGYLRKKPLASLSVKDLIALRLEIFARPGPMTRKFGPLFHQLILLHLHHAQERLETQGVEPFLQYVERVGKKQKVGKGDKAFIHLPEVVAAVATGQEFLQSGRQSSHPKLDALAALVQEEADKPRPRPMRVLVFAQYRDTIQTIQDSLEAKGWTVGRFVGQATRDREDKGMNQREQAQVLQSFRDGRFPILVASSVAEEGLDVPDVDTVVFFESVPSEIRAIQRRGRTGRSSLGRVVVLLTQETRDVGYQRAETRRETSMRRIVRRLSAKGRARAAADARTTAEGQDNPPPAQ
ncbi:MAG: DEAD/DEAH box helicase family protein [Thermoplasmata archaeon]|nr:DEAD/DEAH box helicase family protein [Thermoplasmata archaeon]